MSDDVWPKLRAPFPPEDIDQLPRKNRKTNTTIMLDYVGHAAVTDRLLQVDPTWNWRPLAISDEGGPRIVRRGDALELWISLTVGGVSRLGVGTVPVDYADDGRELPSDQDTAKELIGDCLIAGTPVLTGDGWQPIEAVSIGQQVPTRQGWRPVSDHWLSAENAPTLAVLLNDGHFLIATPHHRVPTNRGILRVRDLRNGDILYAWHDTQHPSRPRTSYGMAEPTGAILTIPTGTGASTTWGQPTEPISTEIGMSQPMVLYPPDGSSTITTVILTTMNQATSRSCHPQSIPNTTTNTGSPAHTNVNGAGVSLVPPNGQPTYAGAAHGVSKGPDMPPDWSSLHLAEPSRHAIYNAPNAGALSKRLNRGEGFVAPTVVAVLDAGAAPVWNLSVADVHEYVANGIFVHNSIRNAAMRFGVALDLWRKHTTSVTPVASGPPCPHCGTPVLYTAKPEGRKAVWACPNQGCGGGNPRKEGEGNWPWASWDHNEFKTKEETDPIEVLKQVGLIGVRPIVPETSKLAWEGDMASLTALGIDENLARSELEAMALHPGFAAGSIKEMRQRVDRAITITIAMRMADGGVLTELWDEWRGDDPQRKLMFWTTARAHEVHDFAKHVQGWLRGILAI